MAEAVNEAMGGLYHFVTDRSSIHEKRDGKEIGISSVRGGSIVGEHDMIYAGKDEVITISHTAYSKAILQRSFRGGKVSGRKTAGTLYHDRCDRSVNRNKTFLGAYTKCI